MALESIDLGDFVCSICREIYEHPVTLPCSHTYCEQCLSGLEISSPTPPTTTTSASLQLNTSQKSTSSIIYKPKLHRVEKYFSCAICRKESCGYFDCRDLETDLQTLEAECSYCSKVLVLCELRKHLEKCVPPSRSTKKGDSRIVNGHLLQSLSASQAEALERARRGRNRSTFRCPHCDRANFTIEHLCRHIEKYHINGDTAGVCSICAAMPWGSRYNILPNVYQHIVDRHRFDYSTYVDFDQDEDDMMIEAIGRSLYNE